MIEDAEVVGEEASKKEIRITIVPPWYVRHCWESASKFLDPAASRSNGRHDIDSLRMEIENGIQLLWIMFFNDDEMIGAFTTSVFRYPKKSVVSVAFAGGDGITKYREEAIEAISNYALEMNCDGIEVVGRKGWLRVLEPLGFEESFLVIEKDLKNG